MIPMIVPISPTSGINDPAPNNTLPSKARRLRLLGSRCAAFGSESGAGGLYGLVMTMGEPLLLCLLSDETAYRRKSLPT